MRVQTVEGKEERHILIGLVTSNQFLGRIAAKYEKDMLQSEYANLIADWCLEFHQKYNKAPKRAIEGIFEKWARKSKDKEKILLIEKFLGSLSDEYDARKKDVNVDVLMDRAGEFFNKVKITRLKEGLERALESGDVEQADTLLDTHRRVEMGDEEFVNPFSNRQLHLEVLKARSEPLFRPAGVYGRFWGNQLARENFIGIQGPEKGGKSFLIQDLCHRGAMNRLNVIFFGIGDMSKNQTIPRYWARLCRRPVDKREYIYPVSWETNEGGIWLPKIEMRKTKSEITIQEIEAAREKFQRHFIRTKRETYRMYFKPTMSVADIRVKLDRFKDIEGWYPDIIAVDYADLLEPPRGKKDKLDIIDENWRQLRNLALVHHCLVLTATQVKRTAYTKQLQDLRDTADNKMKAAHVTGMVGINFTPAEYDRQTRRLNWAVPVREGNPRDLVHIAGCYSIASPAVLSC